MIIWAAELKELEKLHEALKGQLPNLEKELGQLIKFDDPNVILLYSRRCLEVIITDLCEYELKRSRGTEPLKGIIDKLFKEQKVPPHIVTSMHGLNDLSTYGTHPKDFDPKQVKPVLNNLDIIIRWYLGYKGLGEEITAQTIEEPTHEIKTSTNGVKRTLIQKNKKSIIRLGIILLVIILAGVLYFTNILGGGNLAKGLEKSIAVLPFINDSQNDSTTYFMDGVMEEILTNLQTVKNLRVISRTSVERYRKQTKSIPEIAKELGVNYIMEGSGQKSGNKFRLRVQLIRAAKESHLWAKSYEQENPEAKDYFSIQSQIAQTIAEQLEAVITTKEKKLIEKIPTENRDAYEAYLKGQFYLRKFTANDLDTALHYFNLAKEIDPEYALAYAGICDVWAYRQQSGIVSPAEGNVNAITAVMKAYELDSTSAEVQYSLAHKKTWGLWDWKGGEAGFKKSLSINPNNAMTHALYSHLLNILGRSKEAMEQIDIALKLDPMNPFIITFYAIDLQMTRKYDESIRAFYDALKIEPGYPFAAGNLGNALYMKGRYKEALEQFKSCNISDPEVVKALEQGYIEGGYKAAMISYNKLAELRSKTSYWNPCDIAMTYVMAGENNKAIKWLQKAFEVHDPNLPYLFYPLYDNLREDPRFQEIAKKMNLPYK
jgi:TolB-like protein